MHATLTSLKDKKRYLDDQIKSYHLYIDQSMAGIQKKRCVDGFPSLSSSPRESSLSQRFGFIRRSSSLAPNKLC